MCDLQRGRQLPQRSQASDLVTCVARKATEVPVNLLCSHFVLTMRGMYSYIDAVMGNAYSRLKKIVRSGEIGEEAGRQGDNNVQHSVPEASILLARTR